MLRVIYILLFFISTAFTVKAQSLVTDQGQLNFGQVFENEEQSQTLTISNTSGETIRVIDISFFDTFDSPAFTANEYEFDLAAGQSKEIEISFSPFHNILHNTEMFIVTENRGTYSVDLIGECQYSNSYYNETYNLSYDALMDKLSTITGIGYIEYGYNSARDFMYMQVDNQKQNGQGADENTIACVYTGEIASGYTNRQQLQGMGFNCEHTWPQSFGAGNDPMQSDMHHLFPTEQGANSTRGNSAFNIVVNPTWEVGGSKYGNNAFEPKDDHKGAAARAILYFATRYKDNNGVNLNWLNTSEDILRLWNNEYPPSEVEITRNEDIAQGQNNRNPYIDYPQFADRINRFGTVGGLNNDAGLVFSDEDIDFGMISDDQDKYYYAYAIYNDGMEDINLSNFALQSENEIEIDIPLAESVELEPGEDYSFLVSVEGTSGSVFNKLTFSTDEEDVSTVEVAILANTTVGINQTVDFSDQVQIYPNPTQRQINLIIDEPNTGIKKFSIFDNKGKLLVKSNFKDNRFSLSIDNFSNGLYWLHLEHGNKLAVKSFVVQK